MLHIATWIEDDAAPYFERTFSLYPDLLFWNARTGLAPQRPDGLLLTGGTDISADYLHQPVPDTAQIRGAIAERDAWEFYILPRALECKIPVLAICRGMQVLNVARGGTLFLDIPHHDDLRFKNVQPLVFANHASVRIPHVNSSHHQALDLLGQGVEVEARHAEDGIVEQVRLRDYPFALGVQYHPERDSLYQPIFDAFVNAVRAQVI